MVLQRIINVGIADSNTFEQNKHIKIINTISLYGSLACFIFIFATLPLQTPTYTFTCILSISVLLLNFVLNKFQKHDLAKSVLLVIMPIILLAFSLILGPLGNEYYLITELVFLFFLFRKTISRIFVFTYLTSCFVFIQYGIKVGFITFASPALEILYFPNIITAFILTFIGLNLFYQEHIEYQQLIEEQNEVLKKHNTEIEERKNDLENINKVKSKLFSVLSHDLRGPLKSLLTLIDMFDNEYITPQQFKKQMPNLSERINNTFNMTENLLDWTKTQLKGINPNRELFDLTETVHQVVQLFEETITTKKLNINIKFAKNDHISSDKEMVKTILRNIIHNAIKFSFVNGKIDIEISTEQKGARIKITDNGQGMEPEIVNAFNTNKEIVSSLGTSGEKGSGLGLSITREFIEILDGEVQLESSPGKGSTFTISLPNYST